MTWRAVVTSRTLFLVLAILVAAPVGIVAYRDGDGRTAGKGLGAAAMLSVWVARDLHAHWRKRRDRS